MAEPDKLAQFLLDTDLTEYIGCLSIGTSTPPGIIRISVAFEPFEECSE